MLKNIIFPYLPYTLQKKITIEKRDIAWLVHPRDIEDITKKIKIARVLPAGVLKYIVGRMRPYIVSSLYTEMGVKGYIIAVPLLPEHFSKNKALSEKRILQALRLAEILGAKTVSTGGFISSIVEKQNMADAFAMNFFDGTRLLSRIVAQKIEQIVQEIPAGSDCMKTVGIIGATTKIGKMLSALVAQMDIDRLYLFGKTKENLASLRDSCKEASNSTRVEYFTDSRAVKDCDITILTAYIQSDHLIEKLLKPNSSFLSVVEPISPFVFSIEANRTDVDVVKGITIHTPDVSYGGLHMGLQENHSFACITEALILLRSLEKIDIIYTESKTETLASVENLLDEHNYKAI